MHALAAALALAIQQPPFPPSAGPRACFRQAIRFTTRLEGVR